jgi:hypothetical protein
LAAIFEPFELESSDWAHFLRLFEFFSDLTESNEGCASPRGSGRRRYALPAIAGKKMTSTPFSGSRLEWLLSESGFIDKF